MNVLRLVRVSEVDGASLGVLCVDGLPKFVTLEDPWRDNEANISCIPEGVYRLLRCKSQKFGETFTVDNVPGRSLIRLHWGNTAKDTEGCILIGLKFGDENYPSITQSQIGFRRFMDQMKGVNEAQLVVVSAFGGGRSH